MKHRILLLLIVTFGVIMSCSKDDVDHIDDIDDLNSDIIIERTNHVLDGKAHTLDINVKSSASISLQIPDSVNWISGSVKGGSKTEKIIALNIKGNLTENIRKTQIVVANNNNTVSKTISIEQAGSYKKVKVANAGTLSTLLTAEEKNNAQGLIVTGTINREDYNFLRGLSKLQYLDLSGANFPDYGISKFSGLLNVEVLYLPQDLEEFLAPVADPNSNDFYIDFFEDCPQLSTVYLGKSLKKLNSVSGLFTIWHQLKNIFVVPDNPYMIDINGIVFSKDKSEIILCPPTRTGDFQIPKSVTKIGNRTFFHSKFSSIDIPDGVTEIAKNAFESSGIESIRLPKNLKIINNRTFLDCENLKTVDIPDAVTEIGERAFLGTAIETVKLPKNLKKIGEAAFSSKLKEIDIPEGVTEIGAYVFAGTLIESITLPQGLKKIENDLFFGCSKLGSIDIPEEVTEIGNRAFSESGLKTITLPAKLNKMGYNVFEDCKQLTTIRIKAVTPPTVEVRWGIGSFAEKKNITLYVPRGSKTKYETHDFWKGFKKYVEDY